MTRSVDWRRLRRPAAIWTLELRGEACLVRVGGRLGLQEMRRLDADLALTARRGTKLVLDLGAVSHVDYRSLRLLSRRAARLAGTGGALALCRSNAYVRAILEVGSPPGTLEVHEREEDAWAAVAARAS
jgi:anti-anti-sigma factor